MSEQKPEAEDGLGENIENGVGNDLGVHIDLAGAVGDTPDTKLAISKLIEGFD